MMRSEIAGVSASYGRVGDVKGVQIVSVKTTDPVDPSILIHPTYEHLLDQACTQNLIPEEWGDIDARLRLIV